MKVQLTQKQIDNLENMIYESLINNPDFGLGEMGDCRTEAERIVNEWATNNDFIMPE